MSDLSRGLKSLHDAEAAYLEAEDYYTGEVDEFFSNPKIKQALSKLDSRFRLNFAPIPVDKLVDRQNPGALTVPANDALTTILHERFWEANDIDGELDGWLRQAAKFGDYYLLVWPGDDSDPENPNGRTIDVLGNSPLVMRAIYSRENSRKMLYVVKKWSVWLPPTELDGDDEERVRVNLIYADRIERWISKAGIQNPGNDTSNYERFVPTPGDGEDPEDSDIHNPFDAIPVFHLRYGGTKPYGTPLHKKAYGAQDAINKLTITHMSTIDFTGFPQRYARLEKDSENLDDDAAGEIFGDDSAAGDAEQSGPTAKGKSKLESGPGKMWWLEGVAEVGQFEAAEAAAFIDPVKFYIMAIGTLTDTPLYEFDLEGGTPPSGEARRRADGPINEKVERENRGVGQALENAASLALVMLGHSAEKVEMKWLPPDLVTDSDDIKLVAEKTKTGVPLRQALLEAGYPTEEVEKWWPVDEKGEPVGAHVSLGDLVNLAAALSSLGTAKTLTSVTDADIVNMVPAGILAAGQREGLTPPTPTPTAPKPAPPTSGKPDKSSEVAPATT